MVFICYPKCTTCQKARKWLDEHKIVYELRDIKTANPACDELAAWHERSGLPLKKFFQYQRSALQVHGTQGQAARHERGGDLCGFLLRTGCWSNARFWSGTILSSSDLKRPVGACAESAVKSRTPAQPFAVIYSTLKGKNRHYFIPETFYIKREAPLRSWIPRGFWSE